MPISHRAIRRLASCAGLLLLSVHLLPAQPATQPARDLPRRGLLGVQVASLTAQLRTEHKLPADAAGLVVVAVIPDGPAAAAGLLPGDLLTRIGDVPIATLRDLQRAGERYRSGDRVRLQILRAGAPLTPELDLTPPPAESLPNVTTEYGTVTSKGRLLRTLLTRPAGASAAKPAPAVFFIQGLGCFSMENLTIYAPFVMDFTQQGFVTLRVDKPGCGDSQGAPCLDSDFEDVVDGYRQALAALRQYDFVDRDRIFIFGHSMGGIIGPILADETPVRGIAVYGTGFRTWLEYTLENTRRQALLAGQPYATVEAAVRQESTFLSGLYIDKLTPAEIIKAHPEIAPYIHETLADETYMYGRHYKFFQQLYDVPLAQLWSQLDTDVLALHGDADFVSAAADHEAIAATVNATHPGRATYRALPNLDHGFKAFTTPAAALSGAGQGQFNPEIVTTVRQWLLERAKGS